jgi:HK97 family phage major capsid protein
LAFFVDPGETGINEMTLKELQAKRQSLLDDAQKIIDAAGDQMMSDEDAAKVKASMDEVDTVSASIDELAKKANEQTELRNKLHAAKSKPDNPTIRAMFSQFGGTMAPSLPHVGNGVSQLPRNVKRSAVKNFKGEVDGMEAQVRAYRFGMWAMATLSEQSGGRFRNQQAVSYCLENGLITNAAHGEGGSDATGSHIFVPDEFGTDLILLREQYGVARRLLNIVPMSSDTKTEPRQLSGLTAYFVGENSAGTESTMSFDDVTLVARKLMVLARLSNELNADAAISFGDKLVGEIAYAFANKEDECVFNGTGTSTYGHITGIRTRLDELTAGTAPGLTLGAGNAYAELTLANFQSVVGSLPQYADRPGAGWVCHKTFAHTVMQRLALAAGGSTATEIINGIPTLMFLGYPVTISQVFPSVEANSQIPVIFGDLSLGAMFGNRGQETIAFSTEATVGGESMWERDQIGVRGTERFDAVVHDYGSNSTAGPIVGLEMAGS